MEDRITTRKGDSFDIGEREETQSMDLATIMSNPQKLIDTFSMTRAQAENVRSLLVGSGAGGIHKLLSKHLGDEVAGAIGGLISGWVAGKVIR